MKTFTSVDQFNITGRGIGYMIRSEMTKAELNAMMGETVSVDGKEGIFKGYERYCDYAETHIKNGNICILVKHPCA